MADLQRFHYDPNRPIEDQVRDFLAGRPVGGTAGDFSFNDPRFYSAYNVSDEGGNATYGYNAVDPRLTSISAGSSGPEGYGRIIDGQYTPVPWKNGKPDNLTDYGQMYYDPQFGLLTTGNNVRDPDARHDLWYGLGIMSAVAGPALYGIAAGAGTGAAGGLPEGYGSMTGVAGDESAGLAMGGNGGGAAGGGVGGYEPFEANYPGNQPYSPPSGNYAPVTDLSVNAPPGSYNSGGFLQNVANGNWQQAGNGLLQSVMKNPMDAARLGLGLYSMYQGATQGGSGSNGGDGMNFGTYDTGPVTGFQPQMQPYQPNPFLQQQMQAVPFMSGEPYFQQGARYGMGF